MNIEQFFARLKTGAEALSGKQLVSLSLAFLAVVALTIGSAYWLNTPNYGVLFSDGPQRCQARCQAMLPGPVSRRR